MKQLFTGKKLFSFLFLLMIFNAPVKSKSSEVENFHEQSFLALYHFKFKKADSLIGQMHLHYPHHFLTHLSRANFFWWKMISQKHNPSMVKEYYKSLEIAEDILLSQYSQDDDRVFVDYHLANIYARRVRTDMMNGSYVKSFHYLRKYSHLIESFSEKQDEIPGVLVSMGVYNYLSDYGKNRYPLLSVYTYMFPPGDMKKGLQQLKIAAKMNNKLIHTDARYFLMKIFFELDHDFQQAKVYASSLSGLYPDNLIFLYEQLRIAQRSDDKLLVETVKGKFETALHSNDELTNQQREYLEALLNNF